MFARTESPLGAPSDIPGNMPHEQASIAPDESIVAEQIDTPNIVDDRVSIEQGGASTQQPIINQPMFDASGIGSLVNTPTIDPDRPAFELPYPDADTDPDPYSRRNKQMHNALAQGQFDAQNPRNRDKGFKGALKEALQNFGFGLSHAQPGMGFWESMALGGAGVGRGAVERSWNEQRKAQQELPMLQQNAKIASDEMDAVARRDNIKFDNLQAQRSLEHKIKRDEVKALLDQDILDFKVDVANQLAVWRNRKLDADIAGNAVKARQAQEKIDELIRNNKVKDENEDNRNDTSREKGRGKNAIPLPPASSFVQPKVGKTTESAARAYLGKKLTGDALENAIKTARANGEIQ